MRMDFLGLQAFVSIAERGSFQRAAAHLNLSQTALSHRMRKFEEYFGVKLMVRTTRQVTLTQAGLDLLPKATKIIADVQNSLGDLLAYGAARQTQLSIGCLPTLASHYLPRLLADFARTHPDVAIRVYDNSAAEIVSHVECGAAEFGITILAINRADMEVRPLLKEPFVLVAPEDHPLAQQARVSWADLAGVNLVRISSQAGNRVLIDDALRHRGDALQWRYEVQHLATAISMVSAGNGLTIVPRMSIDLLGTPGLRAIPLRHPGIARTVGIIFKRGGQLSPAAVDLMALLQREFRGLKGQA